MRYMNRIYKKLLLIFRRIIIQIKEFFLNNLIEIFKIINFLFILYLIKYINFLLIFIIYLMIKVIKNI